MARITRAGTEPLPAFGVIRGGRLDGWRFHFIRFEAYADELLILAKCSAPKWPFPCDIALDHTLFRKLRAVPGERAKRLPTADLIQAAYRGAGLPVPAWLTTDKRMTVRACVKRAAHGRRTL
ncbi:hypothetical protein [Aquincola tertiaricarbonis]|uniref:hypothetical protein n=1 Tax=Aquincola tertiaricarbonis TaxID=391953 RepID=UPI000614D239|nr:hypothetical protein [Aquincola tertiaricarbonis]